MTLPRTVADVLAEHVTSSRSSASTGCTSTSTCPQLQYAAGVVGYVHRHSGLPIASSALLAPITDAFVAAIHRFAARRSGVPWVDFAKGQRKDDVMHEHLAAVRAPGGPRGCCSSAGRRRRPGCSAPRSAATPRAGPTRGSCGPPGVVNHFYFYGVDEDFGPFFLKFCSYFPYNAKLCINGNEWAKRQAAKAGIGFAALDNGFAAVDDPAAAAGDLRPAWARRRSTRCCASGWPGCRTRSPPADRAAGYRYDISILQAEFSLTQMLDRPVSGRVFFEQVIRDNLDLGRPDQVGADLRPPHPPRAQRPTPGRFRTRVITEGVTPSLHVDYKHATIKQYHKEGRALRTETTINDTRDFGIGKTADQPARAAARSASPPTGASSTSNDSATTPPTAHDVFTAVNDPVITADRHPRRRAALRRRPRPGAARRPAGLPAAPRRVHQPRPARPRRRTARQAHRSITAGQITYDLRRLRAPRPDRTQPHTHRYRVTDTGLAPRPVPHPRPRPTPTHRTRPTRTSPTQAAPRRQPLLPEPPSTHLTSNPDSPPET